MRNTSSTNKSHSSDIYWRRRPSELRGYNRTIYTTTEDGDYLRVDYNLKDRRIRLYIEDNEEGGNPYFSVITNGNITVERNATTGRISDLKEKIGKRADIFSTISSKDVLKLINNNYHIGIKGKSRLIPRQEGKTRQEHKINSWDEVEIINYRSGPFSETDDRSDSRHKKRKYKFIDIVDILAGSGICFALYFFNQNFVTLGVLSAFIGIFVGLLDVYYRERQLIFIKMLLFLLAGIVFYIYGYYIL
jgi:hypothetical protein